VIVERFVLHHGGIEHHTDTLLGVVDHRKRRDGPRLDPQRLAHQVGGAEGEAAARPEQPVQ
jgi:hypothetical protein